MKWLCTLFLFLVSVSATAWMSPARTHGSKRAALRRILGKIPHGGAQDAPGSSSSSIGIGATIAESPSVNSVALASKISGGSVQTPPKRPLKVLFLSADTGGGHRASAEALGKQFALQFPGSTYELADLWTDHGVLPYKMLVPSYTMLLKHPWRWRFFYHMSNIKLSEMGSNIHSLVTCGGRIKKRLASIDPDVIVSVHPTMNHTPLLCAQSLSKQMGKHIPFFTVVTDLGSGHCMWFEKNVNKIYVASDRLYRLARRRGGTPKENIVMAGLPIRHGFAEQAEQLGDRNSPQGKAYQQKIKESLGIESEKPMILVMGGGEGVGSLSDIVDELHAALTASGVDATICVVCGRNEKLKASLDSKDWSAAAADQASSATPKRRGLKALFGKSSSAAAAKPSSFSDNGKRTPEMKAILEEAEQRLVARNTIGSSTKPGSVDVVGLGFITNMPEYMVAADILVTKAGPGTIAEAASVGLPVMLTSFLPGQEAGNVDVVLECGYGDYCEDPVEIAKEVDLWLQDESLLINMSKAAQSAGNPYAADEIVADIGSQTVAWMQLNES